MDVEFAAGAVVRAAAEERQREGARRHDDLVRAPLPSAAMIADRSEMWPVASWPVVRFFATVSENVLTLKVESTTRPSSPSSVGRSRRTLAFSLRLRKFNIGHLLRELCHHRGRNPKFGSYQIRAMQGTYQ